MTGDQFWLIFSVLGVLFLGYVGLTRLQNRQAARKWPTTGGSVTKTTIELQDRGEQSVHFATVRYVYTAKGETYSGAFSRSFLLYGRAEKWVAAYPADRPLVIRYNPGHPMDSMLFEHEQPEVQA